MDLKELLRRPNIKFRNPDTGEIFNNLQQAADVFCLNYDSYCQGCPINKANGGRACRDWIQKHPHKAARLMGYVEENKEENMVKEQMCRLCWSRWNCCTVAQGLLQGLRRKSWIGWKRDCGRDRA